MVIHNEASNNSIVHIIFSVSGASIKDRIVITMRDVRVTEWENPENVINANLNGIDARGPNLRLIADLSAIIAKFSSISTLKVDAIGTSFPRLSAM